jgi:mycothiol system anti-sigma-R factor
MSCGEPHDTDCSEVIEAVYLYLDGEIDHDSIDRIRQHLDECSPCLREYGIEREVKVLVARSCCESAPPSLRDSVIERIRLVRAELIVEASTEYRPD